MSGDFSLFIFNAVKHHHCICLDTRNSKYSIKEQNVGIVNIKSISGRSGCLIENTGIGGLRKQWLLFSAVEEFSLNGTAAALRHSPVEQSSKCTNLNIVLEKKFSLSNLFAVSALKKDTELIAR